MLTTSRYAGLALLASCYTSSAFAQSLPPDRGKPPVDTSAFDTWLSVKPTYIDAKASISNDGRYVLYRIRESWRTPATLIVQAISGRWHIEVLDGDRAVFTENSRRAVFIRSSDSLCVVTLGRPSISCVPSVNRFELFKRGKDEWLAYLSDTTAKRLVLRNLATEETRAFPNASDYSLSRDGRILVLKTPESLNWIDLSEGTSKAIWEGTNASNLVLDDAGMQLAFSVDDTVNGQTGRSLWYYKHGTAKAARLATDQSPGTDRRLQFDGISGFSRDGSKLFISLAEQAVLKPNADAVKVDVWSYTDAKLQSQQLNELGSPRSCAAAIDLRNSRLVSLAQENETVVFGSNELGDDLVLVESRAGDASEWNWNRGAQPSFFLVNTSTGERRPLAIDDPQPIRGGKYIIGTDRDRTDLYSYEIATGITRNLTDSLPIPVGGVEYDQPYTAKSRGLRTVGPTVNDEAVIAYDDYDIWQIDPSGRQAPVNLTNGYGRKNGVELRLAAMYAAMFSERPPIPNKGELILQAVDQHTKKSGFYVMDAGKKGDPRPVSMGPYHYEPGYRGATQIKARDAEVYIVMRESATESPNYFWTRDFGSFTRLSSVHPEKNYNWLTSELVSFTTSDGRAEQAVLYKPEDFDPQKKYPVIIHYYSRKSQELHDYHPPAEPNGELDIPWFVSHGYIVVTPDIHYKIGETGQSALNSVVGVARHISKFPWVDSTRIGLQGHSLGGYQTNYIVTQTNLFAAAVSSSGMSDIVSNYLGFLGDHANHDWYENRIVRIGATLWERPDLYIKNSPVMYADKVTTPMLTVANKGDQNVRFEQGLEWFIALRRLGKKVWMLQYDEEGHGVGGKAYKDYVLRMTQFFDHYLKGAAAPKWMTQGVPARRKGIETGLELDEPGKTPGPGLLLPRQSRTESRNAP